MLTQVVYYGWRLFVKRLMAMLRSMDEAKARKILGDAVQEDDSLGGEAPFRFGIYRQWTGGSITLGDVEDLTADELEAIAWWIRNKTVKD